MTKTMSCQADPAVRLSDIQAVGAAFSKEMGDSHDNTPPDGENVALGH